MKHIGQAVTEKLQATAVQAKATKALGKISQSRAEKLRKQRLTEVRPHTVLRSSIVKILPMIDMDKKIFLSELLKLMGYAGMYWKQ